MGNIGQSGIDLVKSFEGYGQELNDGSGRCTAYQERINGKLDRPTIGWGCTKGVAMGMVWTREEAEAALLVELEQHAKRVDRLVTVELTPFERDALISFDYNTGGLTSDSSKDGMTGVLRAINKGDRAATVTELKRWTKFGGKDAKGLVARRAAEVALFLKPVEADVATDFMPQAPEEAAKPASTTQKVSAGLAAGGLVAQVIPPVPQSVTDAATNASAWQGIIGQFKGLATWGIEAWPLVLAAGALYGVVGHLLPWIASRRAA